MATASSKLRSAGVLALLLRAVILLAVLGAHAVRGAHAERAQHEVAVRPHPACASRVRLGG
jgi:hypothetical protein